jgi:anti-sigma factor ChrR (cupin superfamily)
MQIHADFTECVVVDTHRLEWVESPEAGVARKMLDRIGDEVARATSIVRYEPGSRFSAHTHELGEEFFVLSGTFSDERGDYPAGPSVRNPPGSRHTPASTNGCEIFVKLRQFAPDDTGQVVIDTTTTTWQRGAASGIALMPLHAFGSERVSLVRLAPGVHFDQKARGGGAEVLVLEGTLGDPDAEHSAGTWMRYPSGREPSFSAGRTGALFWVKSGHLAREAAR